MLPLAPLRSYLTSPLFAPFTGMAELASLVQRLEVAVSRLESVSGQGGGAGGSSGGGKDHYYGKRCLVSVSLTFRQINNLMHLHVNAKAVPKGRFEALLRHIIKKRQQIPQPLLK